MNTAQRVIKYLAIAFALMLVIMIFGGMASGLTFLIRFTDTLPPSSSAPSFTEQFTGIASLDVEIAAGELTIQQGDRFQVEYFGDSHNFSAYQKEDRLIVRDKSDQFFFLKNHDLSQLLITVPFAVDLKTVKLDTGAGKVFIESFSCDEFDLTLGIGEAEMAGIIADVANIECGIGAFTYSDFSIGKLSLTGGIGKSTLSGRITDSAIIECGIGKMDLSFYGTANQYAIRATPGLGKMTVDGLTIQEENSKLQTTELPSLQLTGGIGKVTVDFYQ